jgi:hypothetical protein
MDVRNPYSFAALSIKKAIWPKETAKWLLFFDAGLAIGNF